MKTIKANNFSQAVKEVEALDKDQVVKIKENINHSDRKHNHVVTISVIDRPGEAKNKVIVNTVIVGDQKLKKLNKNFRFLGFAKLIILHDASQHVDPKRTKRSKTSNDSAMAELQAKLEEANKENAKLKAGITTATGKWNGNKESEGNTTELENDYIEAMSGNKDELISFMVKYEILQDGITNNEGRKAVINSFYEAEMTRLNDSSK